MRRAANAKRTTARPGVPERAIVAVSASRQRLQDQILPWRRNAITSA